MNGRLSRLKVLLVVSLSSLCLKMSKLLLPRLSTYSVARNSSTSTWCTTTSFSLRYFFKSSPTVRLSIYATSQEGAPSIGLTTSTSSILSPTSGKVLKSVRFTRPKWVSQVT